MCQRTLQQVFAFKKSYIGNCDKEIAACFANENSSSVVLTEEEEREALENLRQIADEFDMDELMKWEKIYQHTTALPERQIFWEDIVQAVKDVSFMEIVEKIEEYPFTNSQILLLYVGGYLIYNNCGYFFNSNHYID